MTQVDVKGKVQYPVMTLTKNHVLEEHSQGRNHNTNTNNIRIHNTL